jgi:hypothetical protein
MEGDAVLRGAPSDHAFEPPIGAQHTEWSEFRRHVSERERERL